MPSARRFFLLILTEDAQASPWVLKEIDAAITQQKKILPVKVEDFRINDAINFMLSGVQYYDGTASYSDAVQEAVHYIKGQKTTAPLQSAPLKPKQPKKLWIPVIAGAVAVLILLAALLGGGGDVPTGPVLENEATSAEETVAIDNAVVLENTLMENSCAQDADGNAKLVLEMDDPVFSMHITRRQVKSITFQDTLAGIPAGAVDVSAQGNGKVLAWAVFAEAADVVIEEDPFDATTPSTLESTELYHLYIAAEGGVWAPANSSYLFSCMPNLTSLDFGGAFHTEHAQDMSHMFSENKSLTTLDVSFFNTSGVKNMLSMFQGCRELTKLDVSHFDTQNVTDMRSMFHDCTNLQSLDVSGFDTANVTNMQGMFRSCSSLQNLDVSGFDTANVTDMSLMFFQCGCAESLYVSRFDTSRVTSYEYFMDEHITVNGEPWTVLFP